MATRATSKPAAAERILILGAAGRDFHTFNECCRADPDYEVVAFTAAQIPGIEDRRYPPSLSGVRQVIFAYSDLSHVSAMHLASRVECAMILKRSTIRI